MTESTFDLNNYYPDKSKVYIIVSPPRCSSTAFARSFWKCPEIDFYNHEPYETSYYDGFSSSEVKKCLDHPLHLQDMQIGHMDAAKQKGVVIKEMTFQVNRHFPVLASWTSNPVIFLIRDPRLSIMSKIKMKKKSGLPTDFPLNETGWDDLWAQLDYCREHHIEHILLDTTDFRNQPEQTLRDILPKMGLQYTDQLLEWEEYDQVKIDHVNDMHSLFYQRVLKSRGIAPATEVIPDIGDFPTNSPLADHTAKSYAAYVELKSSIAFEKD